MLNEVSIWLSNDGVADCADVIPWKLHDFTMLKREGPEELRVCLAKVQDIFDCQANIMWR